MSELVGARWRKVYSLLWHEEPFHRLTDPERVICFYALTGPQSTSVGIYRMSTAVAVEDIGNITPIEFDSRLHAVCEAFGWQFDAPTRVLWIPTWLEENPPQSPNVCKSWRRLLANLPESDLKYEAEDAITSYLTHRLVVREREAFLEQWGMPFERAGRSLSRGFRKSGQKPKAQPKAEPKADQGAGDSGIQGFREQRAGLAQNESAKSNGSPKPNATLVSSAREALKLVDPNDQESVLNTLGDLEKRAGRHWPKRADAVAAINMALSENREVA